MLPGLNEEQQQAVNVIDGPTLVLAGAGSGKTRIVTYRMINLIESGIPASCILGVTFTNKAAEEMRERVRKMTQHHVLVSTFHSLGAKILRESIQHLGYQTDFTIYDEDDAEKLIRACLAELGIEEKKGDLRTYKGLISKAKNAVKLPHQLQPKTNNENDFVKLYSLYQQKLQQYNAVDFDDLLLLPVRLWKEHPEVLALYQERWTYISIDEYQDVNAAQYTFVRLLVEKRHNIFVVGDPDQSIYSWRGANVNNILNFERDYPGARVIRLEQNYRSKSNILQAANSLIGYNYNRYEKKLWSSLGAGEKPKLYMGRDERAEAEFVASLSAYHRAENISLNEMAVFYRTHAQSRVFEDILLSRRIPYVLVGGISFYQRREIKDVLAFLRMIPSGSDFVSFIRTINIPKRGLGETTIDKIHQAASKEGMTLFAFCEAVVAGTTLQNPVKLSTKQKDGLKDYVQILRDLRNQSKGESSLRDMVIAAIERTGYLNYIREEEETFEERRDNLNELIAKAAEWEMMNSNPTLDGFLEELTLKSTLDETNESDEKLRLMSIHHGKGLEFTVTFLVGLEEDLFPYIHSKDDEEKIEEERRLCYVGITRAKEYLYLSYCQIRFLWGVSRTQRPSRFLKEISPEFLERFNPAKYSFQQPRERNEYRSEKPTIQSTKVVPIMKNVHAEFSEGDAVFHPQFGIGKILKISESSVGTSYRISFLKDSSERTIVAQYATLTRL